jgi:ABC-2 type transport system permease protein
VGQGSGPSYDDYGAQLLGSIMLFTFFAESTTGAVRSVVDNEVLVRKIQFPRMAIPLSIVLLAFFNLCLNLIVVTIFSLAAGVTPMLTWLEVPLIVAMLAVLSAGVAMLLSSLYVYLRDVQPIWEVVSQVIFYASPVIIPVTQVQAELGEFWTRVYMCNPLAVVFQQFRHAFVTHATPSAGMVLGSTALLVIPVGIVVGIFILGFWVFNRIAPRVAEDL